MRFLYHKIKVSEKAKHIAKTIIAQLNLQVSDGELAFWLNIDVPSDFIAIAVYVEGVLSSNDYIDEDTVITELTQQLPLNFLRLRTGERL